MKSHFMLSGAAMACAVSGVTTMLSGTCSAQIAADSPTDPAYADGWQAGDNGGFGFTSWSMSGTYNSAVQHALDSTSPYNQLGLAWTLFNPVAPPAGSPNPPDSVPPSGDISRAGRGFAEGALQIGQTISVTVDNPTERQFYKGYTIRLVSGGKNTEYGGTAVTRLAVGTFEYFSYGKWYVGGGADTGLFDTDTDQGMRLDVTLTGTNSYSLTMTPLGNPSLAHSADGTFEGASGLPIDWVEFELYNTDSDFYPTVATDPKATDFYISSMKITAPDNEPPSVDARPAPNPSGKNVPGDKQTTGNPNGFFQLLSKDNTDPNPQIYVSDSASSFVAGPFTDGDVVKISSDAKATPGQKPMGGGVLTHIIVNGTPLIYATDADGNTSEPVPIQ